MPKPKRLRFDKQAAPKASSATSRVIVKARTPGYVPPGFTVRTRIDDVMFTADAPAAAVAAATDDPHVESVERARPLDLTD